MESSTPLSLLLLLCLLPAPAAPAALFPQEALPTKSGYLPINASSNSSLFFAFYEAQQPLSALRRRTPLLVWLQGGPGCSSMTGNFFELGPWLLRADCPALRSNPAAWNRRFGLLFIDNPLGTGFSAAAAPADIPRDQPTVARHLWLALQSFLSSYSSSSFRDRPLYLTGESYAGKYIPAAGYYILQRNSQLPSRQRINLQGVAIGNGLTHPVTQVGTHAATGYFTGLIGEKQRHHVEQLQDEAARLTLQESWAAASDAREKVLDYIQNATGLATLLDLTKKQPYQTQMVGVFLNKDEVKEALGVAGEVVWYECSDAVAEAMHEDVMKSVKFEVEELVRRSRVLLYQGIFDLQDGVVQAEAWMKEMEWEGLDSFLQAERKVWTAGGEVAGYVQRWGSLSHAIVAGAGHLVPADQGLSSQAMIEDWVLENGLFGDATEGDKAPSLGRSY